MTLNQKQALTITHSHNCSFIPPTTVYSTATGQQTTAAPLLRSDTTQDGSSVDDAGPLDKSRDDVLATLYTNYVSGLRSKVKGRGSRSKKQVTIAVSRKNKRAKVRGDWCIRTCTCILLYAYSVQYNYVECTHCNVTTGSCVPQAE